MNGAGASAHATRVRIHATPSFCARRETATIGAALAMGAALAVVSFEPWHGPTLLALSRTHGVDTGDLVAAPFVVLALVLVWLRAGPESPSDSDEGARAAAARWAGPLSAALLGGLLLSVGISRLADDIFAVRRYDELLRGCGRDRRGLVRVRAGEQPWSVDGKETTVVVDPARSAAARLPARPRTHALRHGLRRVPDRRLVCRYRHRPFRVRRRLAGSGWPRGRQRGGRRRCRRRDGAGRWWDRTRYGPRRLLGRRRSVEDPRSHGPARTRLGDREDDSAQPSPSGS